jgi:hypothetical protein
MSIGGTFGLGNPQVVERSKVVSNRGGRPYTRHRAADEVAVVKVRESDEGLAKKLRAGGDERKRCSGGVGSSKAVGLAAFGCTQNA